MTRPGTFNRLDRCFACQSERLLPVGTFRYPADQGGFVPDEWLWRYRQVAVLVRCSDCGSQGPLERPSPDLLRSWYMKQSYAAADLTSEGHRLAVSRLSGLEVGTLVDVGCGAGTFLDMVAGISAYGLEPSLEGARYGRTRGRQIVHPDAAGWSPALPDTVDAVSLFDVIEHLANPRTFLQDLTRHLRPGGRLLIFTGNASSAWAREWNIRWWYHGWAGHLSCFTATGLLSMLRQMNLELESIDELVYMKGQSLRFLLRHVPLRFASRLGVLGMLDAVRAPIAFCPLGLDHMLVIARRPSSGTA